MENTALSPFSSFESLTASDDGEEAVSFPDFPKYPLSFYSEKRTRSSYGDPRGSPRFFADEEPHHFLDLCALCRKPLGGGCDIFMYRGDTPFCSEECRKEQIEMDEAKEKRYKMSGVKAKEKESKSNNPSMNSSKSEKIDVRAASTVVAG